MSKSDIKIKTDKPQQNSMFGEVIEQDRGLKDRFVIPPFSVLDTRAGDWQNRKRRWKALGLQSELGRGEAMLFESEQIAEHGLNYYRNKARNGVEHGSTFGQSGQNALNKIMGERKKPQIKGDLTTGLHLHAYDGTEGGEVSMQGTSVFDPVLCELMYYWFCPPGGRILDCFAGGSVRGIVANYMDFDYTGVDLRPEQILANYEQGLKIVPDNVPDWICGDSAEEIPKLKPEFDFVFSCPPYHDLEIYSDDPRDLSNMSYTEFLALYLDIIKASVAKLKPNRFACFVIGDIRDPEGYYRGFVDHTRECFHVAGAKSYNELILLNVAGSAPIRAGKMMSSTRKICKVHQNVLVFYKGDPKTIKANFPNL